MDLIAATVRIMELEEWHRWWKSTGARELRSLLMKEWDPIGVAGVPEAYDEYDSYAGPLARRLREGANARDVAEYLAEVETERMGLPNTADQLDEVGVRVLAWYSAAMRR